MNENEGKVTGAEAQEATNAGMETAEVQAAETVQTETEPTTGTTDPAKESENDTETEHEAAGEGAEKADATAELKTENDGPNEDNAPGVPPVAAVVNEQLETAKRQLLTARSESLAAQAGIRPDRIKQAVKLADLNDIDPMADDAESKIAEKIRGVCSEMPELLATASTGAAGAFARKAEPVKDAFERGFSRT